MGDYYRTIRVIGGDARSVDYGLCTVDVPSQSSSPPVEIIRLRTQIRADLRPSTLDPD